LLATAAVGLLLGNVVAAVTRGIWNMAAGGANDWVAFAAAGRLLAKGSRCLYCASQLAASETNLLGHPVPFGTGTLPSGTVNYLPFLNPPSVAFVIAPLAVLPATLGFALFAALSMAAIAVAYRVLTGPLGCRPLPTFFAVFAVPGILGLALGQWAAILTLALVLALWALRPRPILAGLALSVLLIKPQYLWLVPVALVVTRKWRVLVGLAIGAAVTALSSLALVGPGEVHAWISLAPVYSNAYRQSPNAEVPCPLATRSPRSPPSPPDRSPRGGWVTTGVLPCRSTDARGAVGRPARSDSRSPASTPPSWSPSC
jgi:hypothetical protein